MSVTATQAENKVTAALLSEEFTGCFVPLYLMLSDQIERKVQLQQGDVAGLNLAVGSTLHAAWPAYVLKEP